MTDTWDETVYAAYEGESDQQDDAYVYNEGEYADGTQDQYGYSTYDQWDPAQGSGAAVEGQGYDYTGYAEEYAAYGPNDTAYETTGEWAGTYSYAYASGDTADPSASYFALDEPDPNALTSPFGDEAYWQQYGEADEYVALADEEQVTADDTVNPVDLTAAEGIETSPEQAVPTLDSVTSDTSPVSPATADSGGQTSTNSALSQPSKASKKKKKVKTKQERIEMRQQQLEKEEEEAKLQAAEGEEPVGASTTTAASSPGKDKQQPSRPAKSRPPTFLERERAKVRLQLRKARAVARKRIPIQVRILTEPRKHWSSMERYFGGCVESALSDIFWASMKGDLRRVKFLVEIEQVSVTDCAFDPWHMEQTPLHWAAKGGHADVIEYLVGAGANPRSLDETGSMPLHLCCWTGHVEGTLALLRVADPKDLYVQDYDAGLAPLDWVQLRGHTTLLKAIEKYEDMKWLPKFVDDLIRGIIKYKIKLFKEPIKSPKSPTRGINFRRIAAPALTSTTAAPSKEADAKTDPEQVATPTSDMTTNSNQTSH